jgi:RNA-directed DNA polymerase
LDDLDKELERRGHRFCRYADDVNIYVKSKRSGDRVMASMTHFLEVNLRLRVNRDKSTVDRPWKRKFLGYTVTNHRSPRLKPAPSSVNRAKDRIREMGQPTRLSSSWWKSSRASCPYQARSDTTSWAR